VHYPRMPKEDSHAHEAWKEQVGKELSALGEKAILVGHSFGASTLLKYLSEERVNKPISGALLIAPPYWGAENWQAEGFALHENVASRLPRALPLFFYHSRDDEVVPFAHLELYRQKLPEATVRVLDGRGHQLGDDLFEVARDIQGLDAQESDFPTGIGKPARRALLGAGYSSLEQLTGVSEGELKKLHGMGPKALGVLREALRARGLSFADGR